MLRKKRKRGSQMVMKERASAVWGAATEKKEINLPAACLFFEKVKKLKIYDKERTKPNNRVKLPNQHKVTYSGHICSWRLFLLPVAR